MMDEAENIRVVVRVRPFLSREDNNEKSVEIFEGKAIRTVVGGQINTCSFDHAFGEESTQAQIFEQAQHSVSAVMQGYNATIFAYGQTGTGKTHTMLGVDLAQLGRSGVIESDRMAFEEGGKGIIPRSVEAIFQHIAAHTEMQYTVKCSYLEIYNDKVYDLFNYETSLLILNLES